MTSLICSRALAPACALLAAALVACGPPPKPADPVAIVQPDTVAVALVDPHLIEMTAEPSATLVTAGGQVGRLAVRVRITASAMPDGRRPQLNLALVMDTSGSMENEPIAAARTAALAMLDRMLDGDRLSVTIFHTTAEALVPSTILDPVTRKDVRKRIEQIEARGTTDLAAGLSVALGQLGVGITADSLNRVVLLSDGVPNDAAAIPNLILQATAMHAPIAALGFGIDYDETLLGGIAMQTGGSFRYLDEPDEVAQVFDEEVVRMTQLVGRNLQLSLQPGPGITLEEIPGFASTLSGAIRYVTVGDLAAGETRDIIVPMTVPGRRDGAVLELVDANLAFEDVAGASGWQKRDAFVAVHASSDAAAVAASVKLDLDLALVRAVAAGSMLQAIALARSGQLEAAREVLTRAIKDAKAALKKYKDDTELAKLIADMEKLGPALVALVPPPPQIQIQPGDLGSDDPMGTAFIQPTSDQPSVPMPSNAGTTIKESHARATDTLDSVNN
jgi:Ca-activated chloride channel family protein